MSEPTDPSRPDAPQHDPDPPSVRFRTARELSVRLPERGLSSTAPWLFVGAMLLMLLPLGFLLIFGGDIGEGKRNVGKARSQVRILTLAVDAYFRDHKEYPPSLEDLLRPDPAGNQYLTGPEDLIDPWGLPYQYDPAGPNNDGIRPDIWADGPRGRIRNWPDR
jgi:hypothetical protein